MKENGFDYQNKLAIRETAEVPWFPANLAGINRRFEHAAPEQVLRWGLATYGNKIVLATGFGPSGVVLMHMVSRLRARTIVFYLQTDLFFPETMALRDELADRLGLNFVEVHSGLSLTEQAHQFGPDLWRHNPDLCCHLRKSQPLGRFLAGKKAWITGVRRDHSVQRRHTKVVDWDSTYHVLKLNPLAGWSQDQVWERIKRLNLPYNQLHDQGYPSIGCQPCTRAVSVGEDMRAGRWSGSDKSECGIHVQADGTLGRIKHLAMAQRGQTISQLESKRIIS